MSVFQTGRWWKGARARELNCREMLWKQPQGQTRMIKGLVMLWERKKKILKKAKTRQSISTRTKDKNVFKVMPWEQASAAAREIKTSRWRRQCIRVAEDKGAAYPVRLSFVCWFHCFFPDWMKPKAVVCQA